MSATSHLACKPTFKGLSIRVEKWGAMSRHCCEKMRYHVEYTCDLHPDRFECPDCLVHFSERRNGYGLIIHADAGGGMILIDYCPWCGTRLPERNEIEFS